MSRGRKFAIAAGALLLMGAISAGAWAAIPDSGGVIHGCYKLSNPAKGSVLIVDSEAGGVCPSGYAALNWNQSGLHGHEVVEVQGFVSEPSGDASATAGCPAGKVVLGGGASGAISDQQHPILMRSSPVWNGTQWIAWQGIAHFELPLPDPNNNFITVWAICAFPA